MVHIANGWSSSDVNFFWNSIFIAGEFATTDFDLFGFSFYPFYDSGATYSALQSTMTAIVNKFGKVKISYSALKYTQITMFCRTSWSLKLIGPPLALVPVLL